MAGDLLKSILLTVAAIGMISVNSLTLTTVYRSKELRKDISTPFLISLFIALFSSPVLDRSRPEQHCKEVPCLWPVFHSSSKSNIYRRACDC